MQEPGVKVFLVIAIYVISSVSQPKGLWDYSHEFSVYLIYHLFVALA